jgi:hypothetical protein
MVRGLRLISIFKLFSSCYEKFGSGFIPNFSMYSYISAVLWETVYMNGGIREGENAERAKNINIIEDSPKIYICALKIN